MTEPTGLTLTPTRLFEGVWEAVLSGVEDTPPTVEARHTGRALEGLTLTALPGQPDRLVLRLPIPAAVLSEGVQTIVILVDGEVMEQLTLIAGVPLEEDLRAEIGLLRAELDLLKRAFQRHCAEVAG